MTRNEALRKDSGEVDSDDPFVDFMYHLMRDEVTPGKIEAIVGQMEHYPQPVSNTEFTNGYLADYAKNVVGRIRAIKEDS